MYKNNTKKGGRSNIGEIVIKIFVLQQWYGLSDPEIERQIADRISFRKFLGFSLSEAEEVSLNKVQEIPCLQQVNC